MCTQKPWSKRLLGSGSTNNNPYLFYHLRGRSRAVSSIRLPRLKPRTNSPHHFHSFKSIPPHRESIKTHCFQKLSTGTHCSHRFDSDLCPRRSAISSSRSSRASACAITFLLQGKDFSCRTRSPRQNLAPISSSSHVPICRPCGSTRGSQPGLRKRAGEEQNRTRIQEVTLLQNLPALPGMAPTASRSSH